MVWKSMDDVIKSQVAEKAEELRGSIWRALNEAEVIRDMANRNSDAETLEKAKKADVIAKKLRKLFREVEDLL